MLIPTNGVFISESFYPKGWFVARYDAEGLTSDGRWFPTLEAARAYATTLKAS